MNNQLNKQDIIKVLGITGVCVVALLSAGFAWQRMQTNNDHAQSMRVQAFEMGRNPDLLAEGAGPIEQNEQQSNANFQP
ncbi:hypothetical protein EON83_08590 [bacterium]|nr:MAG: hypothetical protein EON83_08590 [bacterium]